MASDFPGFAHYTHHGTREGADRGGGRKGDSVRGEGAVEGRVEGVRVVRGVKQALEGDDCVDEDYGGGARGRGVRWCLRGCVGWGWGWGWGDWGVQLYPVDVVGCGLW